MLSTYDPNVHSSYAAWQNEVADSSVRVQWDPDKDLFLQNMERRAIQIGLRGEAVEHYVHEWIKGITDVTELSQQIEADILAGDSINARSLLPHETEYPVSIDIAVRLGIDTPVTG